MTAIEFFDRTPIENIISSLTTQPDKIVYIGERRLLDKFNVFYDKFSEKRKLEIQVEYKCIEKNNINSIVEALSEIVENEDECVFDITGGEDITLVAMGIVYEKYREIKKINMQRFNIQKGDTVDCDNDGEVIYSGRPEISIDECIDLHGGVIRYKNEQSKYGTYNYDMTDDFIRDIDKLWDLCRVNPGSWNKQFLVLAEVCEMTGEDELIVELKIDDLKANLLRKGIKYFSIDWFLKKLQQNKVISGYAPDENILKFKFKSLDIKQLLSAAGTILELKVFKTGLSLYSDAKIGVYIDWDGKLHTEDDLIKDTENEIDVIFMKGITPIFISCKNGEVKDEELYKFDAVASRFGGLYVKKVLIATYIDKNPQSLKSFKQRAKDMKINLIDDVHNLTNEKFEKMIKGL